MCQVTVIHVSATHINKKIIICYILKNSLFCVYFLTNYTNSTLKSTLVLGTTSEDNFVPLS